MASPVLPGNATSSHLSSYPQLNTSAGILGKLPAPKSLVFPSGGEGQSVGGDLNVTLRTTAKAGPFARGRAWLRLVVLESGQELESSLGYFG